MIREDRELLAELARLNSAMASLALRIMDNSASMTEQQTYAQRLIAAGKRLQHRADAMQHPVSAGEVLADVARALPAHTVELPDEQLGWGCAPREPLDARQTEIETAPTGQESQPGRSPSTYRTPVSGSTW